MKHPNYLFCNKIEGDELLVELFNLSLDKLNTLRMTTAPANTNLMEYNHTSVYSTFYLICQYEIYLHEAVNLLRQWKTEAKIYCNEFAASWRYYALSTNLDLIKRYGGEDSDYNQDGTIRTNWTDEELQSSALINSWLEFNNIVLTSKAEDFNQVMDFIENKTKFDVFEIFEQSMGKELTQYVKEADGSFKPLDWADKQIFRAKENAHNDTVISLIKSFMISITALVKEIEALHWNEDNKDFFNKLPQRIDHLFNCKFNIQ
jgi:hypothetical protein